MVMLNNETEYLEARARAMKAAAAYHGEESIMSDATYDELMRDITAYETTYGVDEKTSVSDKIAAGAVGGSVRHVTPMLSLDNVFSADEFSAWATRLEGRADAHDITMVAEPKLDGLAMSIRYEDGHPVSMTTRGDGRDGEDVSAALSMIANVPHDASGPSAYNGPGGIATRDLHPFTGWVRGEVIFTKPQFEAAQQLRLDNGDKPFANERNGISGAVMGAKSRSYVMRCSFFAYDLVADSAPSDRHSVNMQWLALMGFETAFDVLGGITGSTTTMLKAISEAEHARATLDVVTDGVVIKADAGDVRAAAGSGSKVPYWAIAYKYPPMEVETTLLEVIWQVGRTGNITPRARFTPVQVAGSRVEYATLNNPDDIARKGVMLGDTIIVRKAGEVIPEIVGALAGLRDGSQQPILTPDVCPQCGGEIDFSDARPRCKAGRQCAKIASLAYAVSRDALDIDGLSSSIVRRMVAAGLVHDLADLFTLDVDTLASVEGDKVYSDTPANAKADRVGKHVPLGTTVAEKIVANIETARHAEFSRVLTALGIRGTGRSMSRLLATEFGSMDALRTASLERLMAVDKIGESKSASILAELSELSGVIDRLAELGVTMEAEDTKVSDVLAGKKIVVTGSMVGPLASFGRNEMNDLIVSHGGSAGSSVSKNTSILVAGANAGSKLAKANDLSVTVMSEDEFATMIGI